VISPFYDSMIGKLIAHGADRPQAIARLSQGLEGTVVAGPRTSAAFLHALLAQPAFVRGEMDTGLIGRDLAALAPARFDARAVSAGVARMLIGGTANSPWSAQDAFQLGGPRRQRRTVLVDGVSTQVEVEWTPDGPNIAVLGKPPAPAGAPRALHVVGEGRPVYVICDMRQTMLDWPTFDVGAGDDAGDGSAVRAPIIGRVAKVFVTPGDTVAKGDRIAVVEAMKMEHVLHAPRAGRIDKLAVREGDQVTLGALIATLADA
jgi:3-methylcrotonyl-CoA carboxylase alpha subunit